MANTINWGKVYCEMETNGSWGADQDYTTFFIPEVSSPSCFVTAGLRADTNLYKADSSTIKADATQI